MKDREPHILPLLSRAFVAILVVAGLDCAISQADPALETDADADADADADGDDGTSPDGPETVLDPDCGSLIPPGIVSASGHYLLENMCTTMNMVNPCGRGGSFDYGLRVVPEHNSLVTFSGGVMGGEGYLAVRNGCEAQPAQCIFELDDDVVTVAAYVGESIVAHGGPMDTRGCASVRVDLSVWVLECGTQVLRVPRSWAFQTVTPDQLLWDEVSGRLLLVRGGSIGSFDFDDPEEPTFDRWVASAAGAHEILSIAHDGQEYYLLSRACTQRDGEDDEAPCLETATYLEVFDPLSFELVRSEQTPRDDIEHIAVLGDWIVGMGGGELTVFDVDTLSSRVIDGASSTPVEQFVEMTHHAGEALVAATRQNLYTIFKVGDALEFEQLYTAAEVVTDTEIRLGSEEFPEMVAVVVGMTQSVQELFRLEDAPY